MPLVDPPPDVCPTEDGTIGTIKTLPVPRGRRFLRAIDDAKYHLDELRREVLSGRIEHAYRRRSERVFRAVRTAYALIAEEVVMGRRRTEKRMKGKRIGRERSGQGQDGGG